MSKRSLTMITLLVIGCKTTSNAKTATEALEPAKSPASACEETCAGTFASAKMLGCVEACDQWIGKSLKVTSGASLYKGLPPSQRCSFTYEKRNANQVQKGTYQQLFSFGFRYTDGIGDGDFLITGSGLAEPAALIDFGKSGDQKVFGLSSSGSSTTLTLTREDAGQGKQPTFKIEEVDLSDQESKTLILTLNPKFEMARPFVAMQSAAFKSISHGVTKHDIRCAP